MKKRLRVLAGAGVGSVVVLVASSAMAFPTFWHPPDRDHGPTAVPEINGSGTATAAAIVLGGAAIILSRRKRSS